MNNKLAETTFVLSRVEDLNPSERESVNGLTAETKEGLVVTEFKPGSFVKIRKFIPTNNLFTAMVDEQLNAGDRENISKGIKSSLQF